MSKVQSTGTILLVVGLLVCGYFGLEASTYYDYDASPGVHGPAYKKKAEEYTFLSIFGGAVAVTGIVLIATDKKKGSNKIKTKGLKRVTTYSRNDAKLAQ